MDGQIFRDTEDALERGEIVRENTEQMLAEVEQKIIEQLDALRRTVTDRKSADTATCEAAFLKHLVDRRNVLLRMRMGRMKL